MTDQLLTLGADGERVRVLTKALVSLGFLQSVQDSYDERVMEAVRNLQQSRGLKVTGECDAKTLQSLDEARWRLGDRNIEITTPLMRGDEIGRAHV